MLPQTQIKPLMKHLGIKKEENVVFFLGRLEGWIKKNGNSTISLMRGINKILQDIHQKEVEEAQQIKKINLENVKNPLILKYSSEILELNFKGFGARKIEKWLWENHKAKISNSSIYRFLKAQNG